MVSGLGFAVTWRGSRNGHATEPLLVRRAAGHAAIA